MMNDILMVIVEAAITILIILACRYGIPCALSYVKDSKLSSAIQWVKFAVLKAEQVYSGYTGEEKKEYVENFVYETLQSMKIEISKEQVDTLIESAVKQMNIEKQRAQSTQVTIEAQKVNNVALASSDAESVKTEVVTSDKK